MEPDALAISDTPAPAKEPADLMAPAAPVQKYIRTYARDMAIVEKGGLPDLVPLGSRAPKSPVTESSASSIPFTTEPVPSARPALEHDAVVVETLAPAPLPAPTLVEPADTLVTTYEQGLRDAASRAAHNIPASPAAASWQTSEEERETIIARLREKARSMGLPTEDEAAVPASVPIQPPASALSVPSYYLGSGGIPALPGEPVPISEPAARPEPEPEASSPFIIAPYESPPQPEVVEAPLPPREVGQPSPIHTYTTDFSDQVGATRVSTAGILAAEADARSVAPLPTPLLMEYPRSRRRPVYIAAALVVLGAGALFAAYARYVVNTSPVTLVMGPSVPIFVDEREAVSGHGALLMQALSQSVGHPLAAGAVRLVYDSTASSSEASLFNTLELPAPGILLRNINASGSMAGVVSAGSVQTPFFVLSVASYGDTFAGMLSWESSMVRALAQLYPAYAESLDVPAVSTATSTGGAVSATPSTAPAVTQVIAPPSTREGFADEVVGNHDARVYRDTAGRSILIYGYWNQTTLVIARDEVAFTAILARLASARSR